MTNKEKIIFLYDGQTGSREIAEKLGLSDRYVRRVANKLDLPRLSSGSQRGDRNHMYEHGRRIDRDGYVLVSVIHENQRSRKNRKVGIMFEHRLIMEKKLRRILKRTEVVDHIDGITLHNDPDNLRLFSSNSEHLKATLGVRHPHLTRQRVCRKLRRKRGEIRLRQILRALLKLGKDSPYLLGTIYHIKKAGIDVSSDSKIKLALYELSLKWELNHAQ